MSFSFLPAPEGDKSAINVLSAVLYILNNPYCCLRVSIEFLNNFVDYLIYLATDQEWEDEYKAIKTKRRSIQVWFALNTLAA